MAEKVIFVGPLATRVVIEIPDEEPKKPAAKKKAAPKKKK